MVFVFAAGIAAASYLGAAIGAVAAVATLVLSLLVVFAIADQRSEDDFFAAYTGQRGISVSGSSPLPPATPLLRKGDARYAERRLRRAARRWRRRRPRPLHIRGRDTDSEGNRQTNYYRYTVGLIAVPESTAHLRALLPAQVRPALAREARGRLPLERAGEAGERGPRQALRDLPARARPGLATPPLLPHLHRLARRGSAEEVRLRAGRRHPLLLRQRP